MGRPEAAFFPDPLQPGLSIYPKSERWPASIVPEGIEELITYELSLEPLWPSLFLPGK